MSADIGRFSLRRYRLPLRRAWRSARQRLNERQGLLLQIDAGDCRGYGDCAPLPEMGSETLEQATHWLLPRLQQLHGVSPAEALRQLPPAPGDCPAARCALESALLDLLARQQGRPLRELLAPNPAQRVPLNAILDAKATPRLAARTCAQGFKVLKLKLGLGEPEQELRQLRQMHRALPGDCRLRLDANGAWDADTAAWMADALAGLPVESLEEPLNRPTLAALRHLQARLPFALAVDESLSRLGPEALLTERPVRRLVLKPMLLGGLLPTMALAQRAHEMDLETVLTSVLESSAGLWATAQLAASLEVRGPRLPQGLATAACLAQDLGPPPPLADASLVLGQRPGSGFEPYPDEHP